MRFGYYYARARLKPLLRGWPMADQGKDHRSLEQRNCTPGRQSTVDTGNSGACQPKACDGSQTSQPVQQTSWSRSRTVPRQTPTITDLCPSIRGYRWSIDPHALIACWSAAMKTARVWAFGRLDGGTQLPTIPIPLLAQERAGLDLQSALHRVYDAAGYQGYIYANEPNPPLQGPDVE